MPARYDAFGLEMVETAKMVKRRKWKPARRGSEEGEGARKLPVKSSRAGDAAVYFRVDSILLAVIFAIFHEDTRHNYVNMKY